MGFPVDRGPRQEGTDSSVGHVLDVTVRPRPWLYHNGGRGITLVTVDPRGYFPRFLKETPLRITEEFYCV